MQINLSDFLTSVTILIALVTWLLTYQQGRTSTRHARTAEVIADLSTSDTLSESVYELTKLINAGQLVSYDTLTASIERHVVNILDYYEYLCELYQMGILSKRTIINLRGRLMVRTYEICKDYILETRKRQKRQVYEAFERFIEDFRETEQRKEKSNRKP